MVDAVPGKQPGHLLFQYAVSIWAGCTLNVDTEEWYEAAEQMRRYLISGKLKAKLDVVFGPMVFIPKEVWADHVFFMAAIRAGYVKIPSSLGLKTFQDTGLVYIAEQDVIPARKKIRAPKRSRRDLRTAYKARIDGWTDVPPSRDDDSAWARENGFSSGEVRNLRREMAPEHWTRRGRRRGTKKLD